MRPLNTIYRLSEPRDVARCKAIWEESKAVVGPVNRLSWPTIVAERDGKALGFVSTRPTRNRLVMGPLAIGKACSGIIVMRLIEAYEHILRMAGVSSYWFHVDKTNMKYLRLIYKLGLQHKEETEIGFWFERKI